MVAAPLANWNLDSNAKVAPLQHLMSVMKYVETELIWGISHVTTVTYSMEMDVVQSA